MDFRFYQDFCRCEREFAQHKSAKRITIFVGAAGDFEGKELI